MQSFAILCGYEVPLVFSEISKLDLSDGVALLLYSNMLLGTNVLDLPWKILFPEIQTALKSEFVCAQDQIYGSV